MSFSYLSGERKVTSAVKRPGLAPLLSRVQNVYLMVGQNSVHDTDTIPHKLVSLKLFTVWAWPQGDAHGSYK